MEKNEIKNNANDNQTIIERDDESNTYEVDVIKDRITKCPHINCMYSTNDARGLRKHFRACHLDGIIILKVKDYYHNASNVDCSKKM